MKKLILATVIISVLLVFCGCGQHGSTADSTPDSAPNITVPDIPDAAPDTPDPSENPGDVHDGSDTDSDGEAVDAVPASKRDAIPFEEGQLYAAAYLGYQEIDDLDYYVDMYLDSDKLPIHYVSSGDYYLVIPRYDGMSLSLYVNDIETDKGELRFFDPDCGPFIVQCNASDIFTDITARLEHRGDSAEFSPFISLKDGELLIGERGLDLTKPGGD